MGVTTTHDPARRSGRWSTLPVIGLVCALFLTAAPALAQDRPLEVVRHAGPSRTHTAAEVSRATHGDGSDAVVLARADAYADALAAAPLAAALDAPVLLTGPEALDDAAVEEIQRLGATTALLVGELSATVAGEALDAGITTVRRIRADDGWATLAAVAVEVATTTDATHGLLVEGANDDPQRGWPDALSASGWAAALGVPIFLTTNDALPAATAEAITASGVRTLTVIGGTAAVSDTVLASADALVDGEVDRVAGDSRYDTAIAVARRQLDEQGYTSSIWIASGRGWPDALVAGPAVARAGGVLLLSDPSSLRHSPQTASFVDSQRGFASTAHLVGGTAALSEEVQESIRTGHVPAGEDTPSSPSTAIDGIDMPPAVAARNPAPPIEGALPWSDPATWGGRLPAAGDTVTIPADRAVLLDVQPPVLRGIQVDGTLAVADVDMTIEVDWIVVEGRLAIGTEESPLTRRVDVVLHPREGDEIAGAGFGPIAVQGGTLDIHGHTPDHPWTRLARTAVAGSTRLELQDAPGWAVGDRVVLAATGLDPDEAEERTVVAVSGRTIELDQPLSSTHWGQTDELAGAAVAQHGEVGNLSRNVRIRSADAARATGQGGHVMVFSGSVLHVSGAEFAGLGQSGRLARYPIHFHMMGSASGSYVRGASIHHSFNRCLTIHGSNHVEVRDTVGYETQGHCYFFEDGVEVGNALWCNLGLSTRRPEDGQRILETDDTPATFWVTNPANHLVENAAAGSEGHGFWYDLPAAPTGLSAGVDMDIRQLPFGTFRDNVAHTSGGNGWKRGIGVFVEDYEPPAPAVFEGTVAWKNRSFGMWSEGVETQGAVFAENDIAFLGLDSVLRDSVVVGATSNGGDRTWRQTGVGFYHSASRIEDVTFVNFAERDHPWQHPGAAMEFIAHNNNQVSSVVGARFVNAHPLRVVQQPDDDGSVDDRSAAVRDVDGSISGAPALLSSDHPLMRDAACTWRADLRAHACPASYERIWTLVRDLDGRSLDGAWLTRADGVDGAMDTDDEPERGHIDLLIDRAYRLRTGASTSDHLEIVVSGIVEGHLDLTIPWPHPEAHVYDGWGRWQEVPAVGSLGSASDVGYVFDRAAGLLHVRHTLDDIAEKGTWQRLELCAEAFCGNSSPG